MKLGRRTTKALLGSFMALSLLLRYPSFEHEVGVDSFFVHTLTLSIVDDGHAEWTLNPLSWFGWYPLSYPSGGPFLIADVSVVSGLSIETAILFLSLGFGAFGVLTAFMMAREFRDDDLFCLAVAFFYAFAPRFLAFTLWSASTRSIFMTLLPSFIWIVLRTHREPKLLNYAFLVVFFLLLASTHRLAALLAVVMVAFLAAVLVVLVFRILRIRLPRIVLTAPYRRLSPYIALAAFAGIVSGIIFGTDILDSYSAGELFNSDSVEVQLLNFGVSLARSVGTGLVLAFLGVFILVRSRNKTFREAFLVLSFLGLTPTLFLRQYTGFYILPFITLFAALAILGIAKLRVPHVRRTALASAFALTLVFSTGVLSYELEHTSELQGTTYSSGIYMQYVPGSGTVVANEGLMGIRVASICACPHLPVGGAGTTFQSPELLVYGFFTEAEVLENVVRIPLHELTLESDSPWIVPTIQAEADWAAIMQTPYDGTSQSLRRYAPSFFLENERYAGAFFAYGNTYPSVYAASVHAGAYKIYDGSGEAIWYVAVPRAGGSSR
ncbi:MAG: hypothetical protein ACT4OI_02680 [Methanobacteriota archaeon]